MMDWRDQAACKTATGIDWFPSFERGGGWRANLAAARTVCAACPVKSECLASALADPMTAGIWAGTTESERRRSPAIRARRVPMTEPRCGTPSGYRRHRYRQETPCQACRDAHAIAARVNRHMLEVVR